eukprot:691938-Pelagomonas_calceolata.AAC.6
MVCGIDAHELYIQEMLVQRFGGLVAKHITPHALNDSWYKLLADVAILQASNGRLQQGVQLRNLRKTTTEVSRSAHGHGDGWPPLMAFCKISKQAASHKSACL